MFEMTDSRENHGNAIFIAGIDGFLVAHRAPGLHDGGNPLFGSNVHAVPEREKGIRSQHRALQVKLEGVRFLHGMLQCVHAGGLSHAGSQQLLVLHQHYGVRFGMLHQLVGKKQVFELGCIGTRLCRVFKCFHRFDGKVTLLFNLPVEQGAAYFW